MSVRDDGKRWRRRGLRSRGGVPLLGTLLEMLHDSQGTTGSSDAAAGMSYAQGRNLQFLYRHTV